MLTRKQYRTIQRIKPIITTLLIVGTITIGYTILNNQEKHKTNRRSSNIYNHKNTNNNTTKQTRRRKTKIHRPKTKRETNTTQPKTNHST